MNFMQVVSAARKKIVAPSIPIITSGLQIYLDADNPSSYGGSGTAWYDLSGNSNDGTLVNGTSFDSTNKAFDFDGVNDYVEIPLSGVVAYSMQVWLYLHSTIISSSSPTGLFRYNNAGLQEGIALGRSTNQVAAERITMFWQETSPLVYYRTAQNTTDLSAGWHNFVFNWNGSKYDIFMDGVKYTTSSGSQNDVPLVTSNAIYLGQAYTSSILFYGKQSVFALYNQTLTDAEVVSNFNALKGRYGL